MKGLTDKQKQILEYIKLFITQNKYPPTVREVADHFKMTSRGSYDHIKALEKKNFIRYNSKRYRTIEVIGSSDLIENESVKKVPILGSVAAGSPLFADENFDGEVELPACYCGSGQYFALNVKGDSMKDAGILDGDLAIIHHQPLAENGEIVVAMLEEGVTLKRFYNEKNRIRLQAENSAYPPIYTMDVRILGKLKCIIRRYGK
ncbi:MAG: transcriptional repressor LexA [Spirochaetales bacterium]|nr:transcriptional repressor LexA [Spirochaetales bacterium]